jgi:para-nitrobenzyl esterase
VVIGLQHEGIAEFLGIPYAAPPLGDLRFSAPQPHPAWSTSLQAAQFGSPCPQTNRLGSASTNEDCLFLNVFAPLFDDDQGAGEDEGRLHGSRPVMVFIHGGSFDWGNSGVTPGGPDYTGTDIARLSGAVVVTINYRVSLLGFLPAKALESNGTAGNYGIEDQQLALKWVQHNIAQFGGDPHNVTVFGESAGGISVLYHLVSPGGTGLFQRAIVESSDDGASVPLAAAEQLYSPVVNELCPQATDIAACLRSLPLQTFLALEQGGVNAGPIIDGVIVPDLPAKQFASGKFNHVPVIAGTTGEEGTYLITVAINAAGRALTATDYENTLAADFGANATAIEQNYPIAAYGTPAQALAAIETDSFFACPTENVRTLLSNSVRVFGYEFNQANPVQNFPLPVPTPNPSGIVLGDSHTTELAYVFGHNGSGQTLIGQDRRLSDEVIAYWTTFARTGDPNRLAAEASDDEDLTHWPAFNETHEVLSLATSITIESNFAEVHQCAFWASLGYPEVLIESVP